MSSVTQHFHRRVIRIGRPSHVTVIMADFVNEINGVFRVGGGANGAPYTQQR